MPDADVRTARAGRPGAWDRFWFAEGSLVRLGAFRIVMMLTALYAVYQHRDTLLSEVAGVTPEYVRRAWNPIYAFQVLGLGPPGPELASALYYGALAAIGLAAVGLCTRVACAVAAVLTFIEIGTEYSLGQPHHDCIALVLGLFALPFSPAGARLSLDALVSRARARLRGRTAAPTLETGPWAMLPLRFTQVTAAIGYTFAGASKLAIGGWTWLNGYSLQAIMLHFHGDWTPFFAQSVLACRLMSFGLVLVQATFLLALFVPPLRWFYVPAAVSFHLLTWRTMDTGPYLTLWFTLASFVPLERVPAFVADRTTRGPVAARIAWTAIFAGCASVVLALYLSIFPIAWRILALALVAALLLRAGSRAGVLQRFWTGTM